MEISYTSTRACAACSHRTPGYKHFLTSNFSLGIQCTNQFIEAYFVNSSGMDHSESPGKVYDETETMEFENGSYRGQTIPIPAHA